MAHVGNHHPRAGENRAAPSAARELTDAQCPDPMPQGTTLRRVSEEPQLPLGMSAYERQRWVELDQYWSRPRGASRFVPPQAKAAASKASNATKSGLGKASRTVADAAPPPVKKAAESMVDAALLPTADHVITLLELLNDWVVELNDPQKVIQYHQKQGRDVATVADLKRLDLEQLDEVTRGMTLRWRTLGAGQGAAFGALAMIPVPVVGSVAAISLDMIAMQALSGAIATRVAYAYGYDAGAPEIRPMIDRMAARSYAAQLPKAKAVNSAGTAFSAAKGRIRWSDKLRQEHRLMSAMERLMKQTGGSSRVPVKNARMGMPVVAVFAGAATNAHLLGDIAHQARNYSSTVMLAEKYGLQLPARLASGFDAGQEAMDEPRGGSPDDTVI